MPQPQVLYVDNVENTIADAPKKKSTALKTTLIVAVTAATLLGLYALSGYNYLLFHSIVESFSIVIAFAIFAIALNTRRIIDNPYFLVIGIAFACVATLNLFHLLAYDGMGVFSAAFSGANLATQFWLATRYVLALAFLIPLLFIRRKVQTGIMSGVFITITVLLFASIYVWQIFPTAYVESVGLTAFKLGSEYAISIIILAAIGLLVKNRMEFDGTVHRYLLAAMALAIATEMAFTLYTDVYGIMNVVGHLLNVVSFFLIYRALIHTSLTKPYDLLFRDLKQNETTLANRANELTVANDKLKEEIAQRKAAQKALEESEERLQLKLDSVLSPDVELGEQELSNMIDLPSLQATMNYLYAVTNMTFALLDLKGKILVANGWQDICLKFHRINPQTCKNCLESDIELSKGVEKGKIRLYKCKNNMWDVVTPLYIGGKHVGNIYTGQFFFKDEIPDKELFAAQAAKYGFNKEEYLAAFDKVPRYNRDNVEDLMIFYSKLSEMVSKISHSNIKLAIALNRQKDLQKKLETKAVQVEQYASQMEKLANERAKQLKDTERLSAIGATAGMVGHDIRNPLQAITSELYLAGLEVNSLSDAEAKKNLQESIHGIEENIFYINKIVADLQDFAKPLNPKKEQVNIEKTVNEALMMVTIPKNVKVTVDIKKEEISIIADSTMVKRVLVNLIQNAVQAMQKGGDLKITADKEYGQVEISVCDNGEGIPKDVQAKLFTPLMTTKSKGQGFGLAVVKRMTEAMNGTVTFESEEGKRTEFTLKFAA